MKREKRIRKARAQRVASWRSVAILVLGAAFGAVMIMIALFAPATISSEQLAEVVRQQAAPGSSSPKRQAARAISDSSGSRAQQAFGTQKPAAKADPVYTPIGFDLLANYSFAPPDPQASANDSPAEAEIRSANQIPPAVRAFNEKSVSLRGFMLPMKFDGTLTTEFLLLRNQGRCCYGLTPRITEWAIVRVAGKGVKPVMDEPITICGTFHAGEIKENGDLIGIYRLDCERMLKP